MAEKILAFSLALKFIEREPGTGAEASTARFWFVAPHGAAQAGLTGKPSGVANFAMKRMWNAGRSGPLLPRIGGKVLSEAVFTGRLADRVAKKRIGGWAWDPEGCRDGTRC